MAELKLNFKENQLAYELVDYTPEVSKFLAPTISEYLSDGGRDKVKLRMWDTCEMMCVAQLNGILDGLLALRDEAEKQEYYHLCNNINWTIATIRLANPINSVWRNTETIKAISKTKFDG